MSTAAFEASASINLRMSELKILAQKARAFRDEDEAAHNALCRSCCVLIASHIEGFVKEICDSVRRDLNYFVGDFRHMPSALKRAFCRKIAFYEGVPGGDVEKRISQLISFFERNNVPIEMDFVNYVEVDNKNPKPSNIDKPFEKFGVDGALQAIGSDFLLRVFDGGPAKTYLARRELIRCRSNLYPFPYRSPPAWLFFSGQVRRPRKGDTKSMWHTYLEEVVTRRHSIAHGDSLENPTTVETLERDILKAEILLYGLMYYFCEQVCSSTMRNANA